MAELRKPTEARIGQLPPRYRFALNPYADARFSKCPRCERATYPRKFPLLIHIDGFGAIVLGKTCKYCPRCEFLIAHQDELERELIVALSERAPHAVGNKYFVLGTIEKQAWRQGLSKDQSTADILPHTAQIKEYLTVVQEPGGWGPAGK